MKKIIITLSLVLLCTMAYTQTKDCGITFEFENGEVIIENSQKYYAFDVAAYASDDATYFGSSISSCLLMTNLTKLKTHDH